jgi:hypothetical protein
LKFSISLVSTFGRLYVSRNLCIFPSLSNCWCIIVHNNILQSFVILCSHIISC